MTNSTITVNKRRTTKQQAWIEAILTGLNPTDAARIAKYAPGTESQRGCENVTNRNLIAEIDRRRAKVSTITGVTIEGQQREHTRLARLAEEKGDLTTATRNQELIGKTIAAYADKNINIGEQTVIIISPKPPKAVESAVIEQEGA